MFYNIILYGLFPLVVESVWAWLSSSDVYALHVVKRRCTTHILMSCIDERSVRNIAMGTVVVETSREKDVCQVLQNWHSWWNTFCGPRVLVVDEVGPFSTVFSEKLVGGVTLVVPKIDLDRLHNLVRWVSYSHVFLVEPYGVVIYLRIPLESGRIAKL